MCKCRSDDEVEVCAVAAEDIKVTTSSVDGVVLETLPNGDVLATNTIPEQRHAFRAAVDRAAAPYRKQNVC
jgi:hypothetical protein